MGQGLGVDKPWVKVQEWTSHGSSFRSGQAMGQVLGVDKPWVKP